MIFRPSPFANCHIFSDFPLPWSVKYFMCGRETFISLHSVIQRRSRPNYSAHNLEQSKSFAYVGPLDWTLPVSGITIGHLSSYRDDLRLSCLLTQGLMPFGTIANLNDAI